MKVTFLGTGTSHGVPMIGCDCPVCTSKDPHDQRYRSSLLLETENTTIVIDTGYEFRLSMIRAHVKKLDGILYTHPHSDHLMGLDDVRVFCSDRILPAYGRKETMDAVMDKFDYAFKPAFNPKWSTPQLKPMILKPFEYGTIGDITFQAIPIMHFRMPILGYRFGDFAYLTDVSDIPPESFEALKGVKTIVLGALRDKPHVAHLTFSQAEEVARKLKVEQCYFTHISHATSYADINRRFGPLCLSAYDNLSLEV